jgi:hypothetical protein
LAIQSNYNIWLLVVLLLVLLEVINGYLVPILLMANGGYSTNGYWRLFYLMAIVAILLMGIGCYYINDYWWLFY